MVQMLYVVEADDKFQAREQVYKDFQGPVGACEINVHDLDVDPYGNTIPPNLNARLLE